MKNIGRIFIVIILIKIIFITTLFSSDKTKDKFSNVVKSLDSPEKVADWITHNISYVSKYGINEFNDPEKTFELKKGNCAEMAKLTFYILKEHGYNPNLMVIQLGPSDPKNHVVCVYLSSDKKINKIDNGRLSKGFYSYEDIAINHDKVWWRYLLFDDTKNFDEFKNPVTEVYQDSSKKIVKKYTIDQSQMSIFYNNIKLKVNKCLVNTIADQNGKYSILCYGNENDFYSQNETRDAMATGWSHLIYYQNKTNKKNIYSIVINGKFYGNVDNMFQFFLVDTKGKTFYTSEEFPYSSFPKNNFENREFIVDVKKAPEIFFIVLKTFASREDGISVKLIPSEGNVYSYNYSDSKNYNECKNNSNWAIFVKLY